MPLGQTVGPEVIFANDPLAASPRVTPLADGSFVLAWETALGNVVAKHLDSSGNFTTGSFLQALSSSAAAQHWSVATPLVVQERGGTLMTDFGVLTSGTHEEIGLHTISANYDDTSFPFIISKASSASEPLIDAVPTLQGSAVSYEQQAGNVFHTFLRWYGPDGTPNPSDNQLGNSGEAGSQLNAKLVSSGADTVYAVYAHVDADTGTSDIRFEQLTPNGINSNAIGVSGTATPFANFPDMAKLPDGSLIVVWQDSQGAVVKHMLPNGITLETARISDAVGGFLPKVTALNDGSFVVAWTAASGTEADGSPNEDIFLRHFVTIPQSPGSSTNIIASTGPLIHFQQPGDQGLFQMSMRTLTDGRVVLAYASETGDATNVNNLAYRILDFRSPVLTAGDLGSKVTVASDGSFVSSLGGALTGLTSTQLTNTLADASSAGTDGLSLTASQFTQAVTGNPTPTFIASATGGGAAAGASEPESFVISAIPSEAGSAQRIGNFDPSGDMILLSKQAFAALTPGALPPSEFFTGPEAHGADDRVIYNPSTGALSYDGNGSGPGGAAVVAMLTPDLALHAGNIVVA